MSKLKSSSRSVRIDWSKLLGFDQIRRSRATGPATADDVRLMAKVGQKTRAPRKPATE
jgi:hypothetical protein